MLGPGVQQYPLVSPQVKNLGGFPFETAVTLKYVDRAVTLNPAAGSIDLATFSMRNMFDPDTRLGGHQPSNFDRWVTIYNRWTVLRTRVKFTPIPVATSNVSPAYYGMVFTRTSGMLSGSNPTELMEQPYSVYADFPAGLGSFAGPSPALTASTLSREWTGVDEKTLRIFEYGGDSSSGPNLGWDYMVNLWAGSIDGNDPGSLIFKVEIEYDAVFYEPQLTLSS